MSIIPNKKSLIQLSIFAIIIFSIRTYQHQTLAFGKVPIFEAVSLTGESLSSMPVSRPILIHFWATWCNICLLENSTIQTISKHYPTLNIAIQSGTDATIRQFAEKNNLKLNNIINDNTGEISRLFGVKVTPSSFIISPNGNIQFVEVGYTTLIGLWLRLWWAG